MNQDARDLWTRAVRSLQPLLSWPRKIRILPPPAPITLPSTPSQPGLPCKERPSRNTGPWRPPAGGIALASLFRSTASPHRSLPGSVPHGTRLVR